MSVSSGVLKEPYRIAILSRHGDELSSRGVRTKRPPHPAVVILRPRGTQSASNLEVRRYRTGMSRLAAPPFIRRCHYDGSPRNYPAVPGAVRYSSG
jgi:hypothetical protein